MGMYIGRGNSREGLILSLDAGNPKSYTSGSSLWKDLSGNNVDFYQSGSVGSTNNLTFETLNGVQCFQFNEQKAYAHDNGADLDLSGAITLEYWVYFGGLATRTTFFEKGGTTYLSYQQEIAMTLETDNAMSWFWGVSTYDQHKIAIPSSQWVQFGITRVAGTGTKTTVGYINGQTTSFLINNYRNTSAITATNNQIRIGVGYAINAPYNCMEAGNYVSIVRAYNRMLTDGEIEENFNAERARFGI